MSPWGLARFDGVNFVPWTPPRDIPFTWRHFTALLGSSDGSLWIGTASGLGRLKDGHFRSYSKPEDRWGIGSIIEDHAGHIWVTRYRVYGEGAICEALDQGLHCYGPADGVTVPYGTGLAEDSLGSFWIGSVNLCRWKPGSTCATYFNKGPADADIYTATVASGPSQTVWAVANPPGPEGGLQRFSAGKWSPYSVPGFNGSTLESEAMLADRDGSLWVGTKTAGLYRIHNGVVDHYGSADGLSGHEVAQIYEDHEGNLWVTTEGGVDMFRNTPVFSYSVAQGLSSAYPTGILAARDGSIWIGTDGGIDVLRDGRKPYLPAWPTPHQGTDTLFEDHRGTIWFALGTGDFVYWEHSHFHLLRLYNDDCHGRLVTGITEDVQHNLWALSDTCLLRIDQPQVRQYIPLPKNFVASGFLAADPQGGIWISDRASHIFRYSNGKFQTMELKGNSGTNAFQAMIADADDPLLVATLSGLLRWDGQRSAILDRRNGLPCTQFVSIVKDAHGALWLGAEHCGFLRIDPSELAKWRHDAEAKVAVKVLDRFDGADPGQRFSAEPNATTALDGRVWFTTGFDVETFDPDHLFQNSVLPPVHVQTVIADDKGYEPSSALRLPARTRNLEIDYTALSLSVPQKVKFRYKLEGRDTAWQNPDTRRQVFYTDLKPGSYTFRVIACNNDGMWNEKGAVLDFNIAPAWYQTRAFLFFCVAAAMFLAWALYRLRIRQIARSMNARFDERLAERTRLARELHDTFLQTIQGSKLVVDDALKKSGDHDRMQKAMEQLSVWLAQAVHESRDALNSLRTSTTQTNDLADALRRAAEECRMQGPMEVSFSLAGHPGKMHPVICDEIYRIGYEAIRNASAHSAGGRLEVRLEYSHDLVLSVSDNGKGVDPEILSKGKDGHFGLHGMRERAERLRAVLDIRSSPDSGTRIRLTVPGRIVFRSDIPLRSSFSNIVKRFLGKPKQSADRGPLI